MNNAALGVSGNVIWDDTAMAKALAYADALINVKIHQTTNISEEPWLTAFSAMSDDLIFMMALRARHLKENNLPQGVTAFWQITPTWTRDHLATFREYLRAHPQFSNHSLETGARL